MDVTEQELANQGTSEAVPEKIDDAVAAGYVVEDVVGDLADLLIEEIHRDAVAAQPNQAEKHTAEVKVAVDSLLARFVDGALPEETDDELLALAEIQSLDLGRWAAIRKAYAKHGIGIRPLQKRIGGTISRENSSGRLPKYAIVNGSTFLQGRTPQGDLKVTKVANFSAEIVAERRFDDGAEVRKFFTIRGTAQDGTSFGETEVTGDDFGAMNWPTPAWGVRAVISAGGLRDFLREAIQILSTRCKSTTIYTHTGFRNIDGVLQYLHAGGAIGPDGEVGGACVEVSDQKLADFRLPDRDIEMERAGVLASLKMIECGTPDVMFPLLAAVYRAPLGHFLPVDHGIWIAGPSGVFKSEIAALAQAHFGAAFNGKNLPGSWSSTGNALERQLFLAKDTLFVIDDFAPQADSKENRVRHRDVDRVFRGVGNQVGRSRMNADGTIRPVFYPRSLPVATGEDLPRGHSVKARLLVLEVGPGEVRVEILTELQRSASSGHFAAAMSGYVRRLCQKSGEVADRLRKRKLELRNSWIAAGVDAHARTPEIAASLQLGLEEFLAYAVATGAIGSIASASLTKEGEAAFLKVAKQQGYHHEQDEPAERFLALLRAALASGIAHLVCAKNGGAPEALSRFGWQSEVSDDGSVRWRPRGEKIGWLRESEVYLQSDAAYGAAHTMAGRQGEGVSLTRLSIWKRLAEKSLISREGDGHIALKRTVEGTTKRVIVMQVSLLIGEANESQDAVSPPEHKLVNVDDALSSIGEEV